VNGMNTEIDDVVEAARSWRNVRLEIFKELSVSSEQKLQETVDVLGRAEQWKRLGTAEHALMFAIKEYEDNR